MTMDTLNDGRFGNYKVVLSLRNVVHTGPWTWHGWQTDLHAAGEEIDGRHDARADADGGRYQGGGRVPGNARAAAESVSHGRRRTCRKRPSEAKRFSTAARPPVPAAIPAPYYTDGKIHDVGTGEKGDVYKGYNPPSLIGLYDRPMFLHDGRAKSLEQLLTGPHNPDLLNSRGSLTKEELADLIAYLKSL